MEPRPFSRGYPTMLNILTALMTTFNGATAFQPWIHPHPAAFNLFGFAFNGATAFQPWIRKNKFGGIGATNLLQWSHGLSAVDTITLALRCDTGYAFNGATAFQPWIHP